jgi:acyl-ACP thioesterase
MAEPSGRGRIFALPMRPQLADCAPSGRVRLDALARWVQDVAYADLEDAGLERDALWVVRKTRIRVLRFPRFGERFQVQTFASGIGRMWAERRTTIRPVPSGGGPLATPIATPPVAEVASVWIHLDPVRRVPSLLTQAEVDMYTEAAGQRRFQHRLTHPRPEAVVGSSPSVSDWIFRRTDTDLADHVNNAAYWEPLEEELLAGGVEPSQIDVELEYRTPAQPGPVRMVRAGAYRWLTDRESGELYASMVLTNASTTSGSN